MRRFRFGARSRHDRQVPDTARDPQQGAGPSGPPSAWEPSGGLSETVAPGGEEPTQQQPPVDEPAPIESRADAEQWIPREPSSTEQGPQEPASAEPTQPSAAPEPEPPREVSPAGPTMHGPGDPQGESETAPQPDAHAPEQTVGEVESQPEPEPASHAESVEPPQSRVSVIDEQPSRPPPPAGATEEEYKWHTYKHYPSGRPDAVEFIDTYKAFGRNKILRGLSMGLPEGMVSMILGPSGTGKSVCIKHMVGLLYPDEGDILVHGESVPNMPDDDLFEMRKKFGLLFQDGALFGSMNLFDNVAFPLRQHTEKSEEEVGEIVMRRLNEVGLGSAREKMPNELSGGMRKRAGFARALVLEPDILLFDEPDSGLDPVRTALLGELILEIHRDMMDEAKEKRKEHLPTFCVITHDIMSARRVADYINVLWKGRIVEAGPAEDMLNSDNPFIRQFLSGESQGPLTMD